MSKVYLFDWGDMLMIDFPDQTGKMCDWENIQVVNGALQILEALSKQHQIYVATNTADSTESDIKLAFDRVGLSAFISGYFCKANLGIGKGTPDFFNRIIDTLNVEPKSVVMVGDSYDKDIEPAVTAGIQAIWFNPMGKVTQGSQEVKEIRHLLELCT
ncbi:HAD family hydrolase [Vibrio parahaemolyticus]|uniref:HAD family hydrolase n=1 Tax=Vibrio parahaemolyticus TaxID=670 RepID=UPI00084B5044|nr:HAD family hydrolase [Vibrio parahaemolyticus]EGQ8047266.1 HAD family hydrolase [Vibrio parahaemolyticus]EHH2867152.1 HAD family hydrolase [Vibrio parahaemolyticus]ELA9315673.1 HAD family hydrolase [Vibrio parahaemolyticus]MBM5037013.1 HAD family hydrolase [Vibrio parahaemolyticus]MBM5050711.1 HAD family hydrolase [Vibrio parahaemolyticus]